MKKKLRTQDPFESIEQAQHTEEREDDGKSQMVLKEIEGINDLEDGLLAIGPSYSRILTDERS